MLLYATESLSGDFQDSNNLHKTLNNLAETLLGYVLIFSITLGTKRRFSSSDNLSIDLEMNNNEYNLTEAGSELVGTFGSFTCSNTIPLEV